jgi:hypothetical protein
MRTADLQEKGAVDLIVLRFTRCGQRRAGENLAVNNFPRLCKVAPVAKPVA